MNEEPKSNIDDGLLLAYLEHELVPELAEQIESNGYLLYRALQLARQEQRLKMWLAPHQPVEEPGLVARLGRIKTYIGQKFSISASDEPANRQLAWRGSKHVAPAAATGQQQYQAGAYTLLLSCHPAATDQDRFDLTAAVLADQAFTAATLWQAQQRVATSDNHLDEFAFTQLEPGQYLLAFTAPDQCVLLPELIVPF
ncbi:MAG: hypothetical protein KDE04_13280 [Anaerolineales bacterium]|nr:hypothetical protein [Anaerolineales bacterium]